MRDSTSSTSWYFLSIYYSPDGWNSLLKYAVIPFVENHNNGLWEKCLLHFGWNRGPYVGLSCEVSAHKKTVFIELFERYFTDFLRKSPSKLGVPVPPSGLYMDFPPNTICHSIHSYSPAFDWRFDNDYKNLWHDSTSHLLSAIKQDALNTNDLFTAALYLNLLLLLSNSRHGSEYLNKCSELFQGASTEQTQHSIFFSRAEKELREILDNCRQRPPDSDHEPLCMIHQWFGIFESFHIRIRSLNGLSSVKSEYELFINMLFAQRKQLGIRNQTLLDYLLYKLLKSN